MAGNGLLQTLKGNIRVFCRVRPLAANKPEVEALDNGQPVISFPDTGQCTTIASWFCFGRIPDTSILPSILAITGPEWEGINGLQLFSQDELQGTPFMAVIQISGNTSHVWWAAMCISVHVQETQCELVWS